MHGKYSQKKYKLFGRSTSIKTSNGLQQNRMKSFQRNRHPLEQKRRHLNISRILCLNSEVQRVLDYSTILAPLYSYTYIIVGGRECAQFPLTLGPIGLPCGFDLMMRYVSMNTYNKGQLKFATITFQDFLTLQSFSCLVTVFSAIKKSSQRRRVQTQPTGWSKRSNKPEL